MGIQNLGPTKPSTVHRSCIVTAHGTQSISWCLLPTRTSNRKAIFCVAIDLVAHILCKPALDGLEMSLGKKPRHGGHLQVA